jgi:hypothetical protein
VRALECSSYHWQRNEHRDQIGHGAGYQYTKVQHLSGSTLPLLNRRVHMASRRKDTMVAADSHEGGEEADCPQGHDDDPCDDVWAILRIIEDLNVEK